jgi:hypothetical protein
MPDTDLLVAGSGSAIAAVRERGWAERFDAIAARIVGAPNVLNSASSSARVVSHGNVKRASSRAICAQSRRGSREDEAVRDHVPWYTCRPGFARTAPMLDRDTWELLSYIVTAIGLPLAIVAFLWEQKKERDNEEEEVYQLLSDNYQDFLKITLDNPDLRLFSAEQTPDLSTEQRERMVIIFNMLISLFERAYILLYEKRMSSKQARRWESWADYMREWGRREDFRMVLPTLLQGEDPEFVEYICKLAKIALPQHVAHK